jgi:hypothetical protein
MSGDPELTVFVGDREMSFSAGSWRTSIRELASAELTVRVEPAAPDWWASLEIRGGSEVAFSGSVISAEPTADGIRLTAASGIELTEHVMGVISAENFPVQDMVYAAARGAGFSRERMEIHGLEELPLEPFEIVVPLQGVKVEQRVELGDIVLLPPPQGLRTLDAFESVPEDLATVWAEAEAFAVVIRDANLLADAELEALEAIDTALAWLTVRVRFGHALLPDGSRSRFQRERGRTLPQRNSTVAAMGLATGRRWIRDSDTTALRGSLHLPAGDLGWPPYEERLTTADRLALLAARDAAASQNAVERVTAMAVAWEFYCAEASPPGFFETADIARLKNELPGWLTHEQRGRLDEVLGMANQSSLNRRLRTALDLDGVPIGDGDWRTLQRVRKLRNRAVHGSEALTTDAEDLDIALSILSRALVYRAAKRSADHLGPMSPPFGNLAS